MNIKKILITLTTTLSVILLVTTATYAIGTLTPSGTAGDATQYTLNDIHTKLTTGTGTSTKSGLFTTPSGTPVASFISLTELYNAIPATLSLSASTTTVPVGINRATTTLVAIDTDLTAANIKSGVNVFGVTGNVEPSVALYEGYPLTWTGDGGPMTWTAAKAYCASLDPVRRLPTISELIAAIRAQYAAGTESGPGSFAGFDYYWSGTESDSDNVWAAGWLGVMSNAFDVKTAEWQVRCVR